jgi:hypothetical protein
MQNKADKKGTNGWRKIAWAVLFVTMLMALAMVVIPVWIVQPFKGETPQGLELAYTLKRWSPVVTVLGTTIVLALLLWLWRGARRWWRKAALVMVLFFTILAAWFARQNHFEWMFKPISEVAYAQTTDAPFVEEGDKVLAVDINGEAVAFPVRQMAYHHIVNDVVGGVPITATY